MPTRRPLAGFAVAAFRRLLALGAVAVAVRAAPVRVGYDSVIEPIAFLDAHGQPEGFASDYLRAISRRAGFEVEFVTGRKEYLQAEFREGRIAVIAALVYTDDRAKVMDFTLPYLTLKGAVFTRKGGRVMHSVADFAGARVAVSRGNVTNDYLVAHPEWGARLMLVDSTEAALRALEEGECDAAVNVDLIAQKLIRERKFDRVVATDIVLPNLVYKYHMAVHKGDAALLKTINEAQLAVHESGEFAEIYEKWIGPLKQRGLAWREMRPVVIPAALLLMVIGVAFAVQRRTLQKLSHQAEALRQSEERLNLVLESGQHCLWDWNVRENRVLRGPLLAKLLGYEPAEIEPTPDGLTRLMHPDDVASTERVQAIIRRPGPDEFFGEARMRTKDGRWRWILSVGRVLERGPDGRALRAVGTHTDITQRKEAEEAVRRLNRELEQRVGERTTELATRVTEVERLNQELEAFSYSVSHDLRAPLRNITGFLELLTRRLASRLDAESDRFVGTVQAEARRMGILIDDLLALSRVGRAELTQTRVPLDELVAEARANLRAEIGARAIEWKVGTLPLVRGDRALLLLVVTNLLSNTVKFTRHRAPAVIEIGARTEGTGDGTVTIFVRDNGAGFNPKYVEKLFGVFQRLHNQRDFEGTGIGLANVKRILTRHGGRVWAEGQVNQGATFYFTLALFPAPHP